MADEPTATDAELVEANNPKLALVPGDMTIVELKKFLAENDYTVAELDAAIADEMADKNRDHAVSALKQARDSRVEVIEEGAVAAEDSGATSGSDKVAAAIAGGETGDGERLWQAQVGDKVNVTDGRGQTHQARIVANLSHAVVVELRDDQGTRIIASYNPEGGQSTWRYEDGTDAPPLPVNPNTRLGRETERRRLEMADNALREEQAVAKLAGTDKPVTADLPMGLGGVPEAPEVLE